MGPQSVVREPPICRSRTPNLSSGPRPALRRRTGRSVRPPICRSGKSRPSICRSKLPNLSFENPQSVVRDPQSVVRISSIRRLAPQDLLVPQRDAPKPNVFKVFQITNRQRGRVDRTVMSLATSRSETLPGDVSHAVPSLTDTSRDGPVFGRARRSPQVCPDRNMIGQRHARYRHGGSRGDRRRLSVREAGPRSSDHSHRCGDGGPRRLQTENVDASAQLRRIEPDALGT